MGLSCLTAAVYAGDFLAGGDTGVWAGDVAMSRYWAVAVMGSVKMLQRL